jgi:hypothetical protein
VAGFNRNYYYWKRREQENLILWTIGQFTEKKAERVLLKKRL